VRDDTVARAAAVHLVHPERFGGEARALEHVVAQKVRDDRCASL